MPIFPIQYSKTGPPAVGPSVRSNVDLRTGAEQVGESLAAAGRQLQRTGLQWQAELKEADEKLQRAKDAVSISQVDLELDGLTDSYLTALETTTDPKAIESLNRQYEADTAAKIRLPDASPELSAKLQIMRNGKLSFVNTKASQITRERDIKETKERAEILLNEYLSGGDEQGYKNTLAMLASEGLMTKAEAEKRISYMPGDMLLAQARKAAAQNTAASLDLAQSLLDDAGRMKLSPEQNEYAIKLSKAVKEERAEISTQFVSYINDQMVAFELDENKSEMDRWSISDNIISEIESGPLTGTEKMSAMKSVKRWARGEGETDYGVLGSLNDRIDRVNTYGVEDTTLLADIDEAYQNRSLGTSRQAAKRVVDLKKRLSHGEEIKNLRVGDSVAKAFYADESQYMDKLEADRVDFLLRDDIRKLLSAHPEWSPEQAYIEISKLLPTYRDMTEEEAIRRMERKIEESQGKTETQSGPVSSWQYKRPE